MAFYQNYGKTQKLYKEFPFLWGVEPRCYVDLVISVKKLDSDKLSAMTAPGTRWWVHFKHPDIIEEVREVTQVAGHNLASEVLLELGSLASGVEIEHLISREEGPGFGVAITIHRPRSDYMVRAPILAECRNRAKKHGY